MKFKEGKVEVTTISFLLFSLYFPLFKEDIMDKEKPIK